MGRHNFNCIHALKLDLLRYKMSDNMKFSLVRSIKRKRLLYDFQDFVDCVNDKGTAILMHPGDFIDFQNEKGSAKDVHCPLIADISEDFLEILLHRPRLQG